MGTVKRLTLASPADTHALGVRLGRALEGGDFVGLVGELGAGKTHFSRGVAQGAGVPAGDVSSPTFSIINPYQGRIALHHVDLYRLRDEDELYGTGFHDLVGPDAAMLVEWLDQIPGAAPREYLRIELAHAGPEARTLKAEAFGERPERLLAAML